MPLVIIASKTRLAAMTPHALRVGDVRVFYDVSGSTVEVLAVVPKAEAASWLAQFGSLE